MKKLLVILAFSCAAVACGGGGSTEKKDEAQAPSEAPAPAAPVEETKSPDVQKGLDLAAKSDCFTCHKVREKLVGPAYVDVSERYQNASEQVIDTLANKVIKGGGGRWSAVAMTPHPQISKEDATSMVKYILSLKK